MSGVISLLETCAGACTAEAWLNTDEAVLAWELAEPMPLSISPCMDSVSSALRCAASDVEMSGFVPSRYAGCDAELEVSDVEAWADGVFASRSAAPSETLDFALSLSAAFSRAARGAAGKNLANPAPDALGAIFRECRVLIFHYPPTILINSISFRAVTRC